MSSGGTETGASAVHARQRDGGMLSLSMMHALFDYAIAHERDARPWLLLARDSMRQGAYAFAVRQYTSAIHADIRAADEERVLEDLVHVARTHGGVEHDEASAIIVETYGERAMPMIDQETAAAREARDARGVERMESLRDEITGA